MGRPPLLAITTAALAGAGTAFMFDPRSGARRRALLRDKTGKYARATGRWLRGRARATGGPLRGAVHDMVEHAPWYEPAPPPDMDTFIKQRVESELGHATWLPLQGLVFDATDGVVHIRGIAPDPACAREIVERVAQIEDVRAVVSLMHTPEGEPVGGTAGDPVALAVAPAVLHTHELQQHLMERWPALTDTDILASEGHLDRLTELICTRTGQPEQEVRATLDKLLLAET